MRRFRTFTGRAETDGAIDAEHVEAELSRRLNAILRELRLEPTLHMAGLWRPGATQRQTASSA